MHLRGKMREQEGQGSVDGPGIHNVVVVKNENDRARDHGDVIEQDGQQCFGRCWLRGVERSHHRCAKRRRDRLYCSDQVHQKARGVAVSFVQRQLGDRSSACGDPFTHQRGFAKPCGRSDEGQLAVQPCVQPLDQAGAADRVRPARGNIQFRG